MIHEEQSSVMRRRNVETVQQLEAHGVVVEVFVCDIFKFIEYRIKSFPKSKTVAISL